MADAGILDEDDRIELIDGEILDIDPIGADHINAVIDLTRALVLAIGDHGVVSVQNPLRLDIYNEPMPDFVVSRPRPDSQRKSHHAPADVLLVIVVAKTSLRFDNKIKLPKYAAAGIPKSGSSTSPSAACTSTETPKTAPTNPPGSARQPRP